MTDSHYVRMCLSQSVKTRGFHILSCEKGLDLRSRPFSQLRMYYSRALSYIHQSCGVFSVVSKVNVIPLRKCNMS